MDGFDGIDDIDFECPFGIKAEDFENGKMPSVVQQVKNLAESVSNVAQAAFEGEKVIASEETVGSRLEICGACDRLDGGRCFECGCFVGAKARLETESCPLSKW